MTCRAPSWTPRSTTTRSTSRSTAPSTTSGDGCARSNRSTGTSATGSAALSRFDDVWNGVPRHRHVQLDARRDARVARRAHRHARSSSSWTRPSTTGCASSSAARSHPRRIAELEAHVRELVDATSTRSSGRRASTTWSSSARCCPPMVIGHMLGVAAADRDMLRHWFDDVLHREDADSRAQRRGRGRDAAINDYVIAMVADRRTTPARRHDHRADRGRGRRRRRRAA